MEEGIPRCLWAAPVLSLAVYLLCPGNSPLLASTIPFLIEHVRRSVTVASSLVLPSLPVHRLTSVVQG